MLEMCKAYATFPSGGKSIEPVYIGKIEDRNGNILEYHEPKITLFDEEGAPIPSKEQLIDINDFVNDEAPQVISEQTAYIMTYLLREVVKFGTGRSVRALGRTAAGKTGTTNDFLDAWFMGFTPDVVTGAWVGFDEPDKPIGRYETGAKTAAPIWLRYMKASVKRYPERDFEVPEGIVFVNIDKKSGRVSDGDPKNSVYEAFVEGTEPTTKSGEYVASDREKDVNEVLDEEEKFFKQGY
jgi:penicillin-binding protein 1A